VFSALHLSNFDLGGRAMARAGFRAQVLTVPDPTDAYRTQNELRRAVGFDVTPISLESLRVARHRLEAGGTVLTGIDRPVPEARRTYRFFGRPAHVPDVHVRLASITGRPLVLIWATMSPEGVYALDCEEVPLTASLGIRDREADVEAVLARAAAKIAAHATQWAMPHAMWPEAASALAAADLSVARDA